MIECSPDCPSYYECDQEHCEYRDEYIYDSMLHEKSIYEQTINMFTHIGCRCDYDYCRGYLEACKRFKNLDDEEYALCRTVLVDIAKQKGIRK